MLPVLWLLHMLILGCFGGIVAALAMLAGVQSEAWLSISAGIGVCLPLAGLFAWLVALNR